MIDNGISKGSLNKRRKDWLGLSEVESIVKNKYPCSSKCGLHELCIVPQRHLASSDCGRGCSPSSGEFSLHVGALYFRVYVFFETDIDARICIEGGVDKEIEGAVYNALEVVGRGSREEVEVVFEFDSYENVKRNYDGEYFLRMR